MGENMQVEQDSSKESIETVELRKNRIENQIIEMKKTSVKQGKLLKYVMITVVSLSVTFCLFYSFLSFNQTKKMEKKLEVVESLKERNVDEINKVLDNISRDLINETDTKVLSRIEKFMNIGGIVVVVFVGINVKINRDINKRIEQ